MAKPNLRDDQPSPVDVYVGGRMRLRRIQLGLSQSVLASKIGVSFQSVQKYEVGDNRISASRLYDVAQALQVTPAFFFEGYPDGLIAGNLGVQGKLTNQTLDRREIMSLIRSYYGIKDESLRADTLRLLNRLGGYDTTDEIGDVKKQIQQGVEDALALSPAAAPTGRK